MMAAPKNHHGTHNHPCISGHLKGLRTRAPSKFHVPTIQFSAVSKNLNSNNPDVKLALAMAQQLGY